MPRQKTAQVFPVDMMNDDVCTLVSIVPFMVSEFKPGIYPGRFVIEPCMDYRKPKILTVGTSVYFIPQFNGDDEMPAHVVKTPCKEIAAAVVNDYMHGQMDVNEECRPGLIWIAGKISSDEFIRLHPSEHITMQKRQLTWFGKLVERADNDWNRYKNHKVVSDNQRFACRALGLEREYLTPEHNEIPIKCPACQTNVVPEAIVCSNCRCILNKEKYEKLTFAA
jgi:hypothetical protein